MELDQVYVRSLEKSTTDKLLARDNIERIRALMKKRELSREDYLELQYLLTGEECKLLNLNSKERYILAKFFMWIRDMVSVVEKISIWLEIEKQKNSDVVGYLVKSKRLMDSAIKALIDLFNYLSRSSLSKDGKAFTDLNTQRSEMIYHYPDHGYPKTQDKGLLGMFLKK